jgi:hypothetical protein
MTDAIVRHSAQLRGLLAGGQLADMSVWGSGGQRVQLGQDFTS